MNRKLAAVLIWAFVLWYFTCSAHPFHWRLSGFRFTHANFSQLFRMDLRFDEPGWDEHKIGHFSGFFIMDLLLYRWLRRHRLSMAVAILFGVTTEIFQLYFSRDGRFFDMVIDGFGVCLSTMVMVTVRKTAPVVQHKA